MTERPAWVVTKALGRCRHPAPDVGRESSHRNDPLQSKTIMKIPSLNIDLSCVPCCGAEDGANTPATTPTTPTIPRPPVHPGGVGTGMQPPRTEVPNTVPTPVTVTFLLPAPFPSTVLPNMPQGTTAEATTSPQGPRFAGVNTADVGTEMRAKGGIVTREANEMRFRRVDTDRQTRDASVQWDAPVPPTLMSLPNETLQRIMGQLVHEGLTEGPDSAAARKGASGFASMSKVNLEMLGPQLYDAQLLTHLTNVKTVDEIETLIGTDEEPGALRALPARMEEQALARLAAQLDRMEQAQFGSSIRGCRLLAQGIGRLTPEAQARVLEDALRQPLSSEWPRFVFLVGNMLPDAEPIPGTVLGLPPHLQVGPLRTVVDFVFGSETVPRQLGPNTRANIAGLVRRLDAGIGEDLKARVAEAGH
jgi:hypothetical protein